MTSGFKAPLEFTTTELMDRDRHFQSRVQTAAEEDYPYHLGGMTESHPHGMGVRSSITMNTSTTQGHMCTQKDTTP